MGGWKGTADDVRGRRVRGEEGEMFGGEPRNVGMTTRVGGMLGEEGGRSCSIVFVLFLFCSGRMLTAILLV